MTFVTTIVVVLSSDLLLVWPVPTLHHHTCLPGHTVVGGDYKYMAGHSNHCGSGRDKRNSNFHYFVLISIYLFRNYQQIMRNYIPLEQINVKSNYFKCCIYEVYNFCIFSSISDYIEHGIHDLPPRKYICVWFSLSINSTKSDRFLSLQLTHLYHTYSPPACPL